MSMIKKLSIENYLGIEEIGLDCSKINIFKGPKGSGKSSILEAIEKAFTNKNRRTEVIRHGEEEATLYVKLDDGLEVDRKIRSEKADYLKVRKDDEAVPSTEKFLRNLINGDIFRPLDWVNMNIKQQTKSILGMLKIDWTNENIINWFGELPSNIDYSNHILVILKAIEDQYYKDREEVNRQIKELKTQIKVILDELPAEYDGELWRDKKVQEYYNKVSEAQKINHWIEEAKALQENFDNKIAAIKANVESDKNRIKLNINEQRSDIKDIIELSKARIEKSKNALENADKNLDFQLKEAINNFLQEEHKLREDLTQTLKNLEEEYLSKVEKAKVSHDEKLKGLNDTLLENKERLKKSSELIKEGEKDNIALQEKKIATKEQELISLVATEEQEIKAVNEKILTEKEKEEIRVGKAIEYIKNNNAIDIEPLQDEADKVAEMQSYLRQWDMLLDIRDNKLASKERYAAIQTKRIDKARILPGELLQTAKMPIDGISVDSNGFIRINNTLIDGLSDGEKLELAMRIAKAQAGELKVICLDKFESLNPAVQAKLLKEMTNDEYQYFVTSTMADEFEIEKIG
ncbi:AAA family ATPase [Clostridium grantii]|uniref:AAA domain-containing protein n=1 Tax=Clostridium grantii DSM 8605 TaxID=1121316 RepID=A0A1M5RE92_9CLOT|nr:AAA family ATPase [Clostridium grantii]SHH24584.1 AAA domain-containing protein [Clostridium grantii DSM 8605]